MTPNRASKGSGRPRKSGRPRQRLQLLAVAALAAATLAGACKASGALDQLELKTIDARFAIRGPMPPRHDIVIVAVDAQSLRALGKRPPLPRGIHAQMIERLAAGHPKVLAYDFQFVGGAPALDPPALAQALQHSRDRSRGALLRTINRFALSDDRALIAAIQRAQPVLLATHDLRGQPLKVPAGETHPDRIGAILGTVELINDADGEIRRSRYRGLQHRSFSLLAAELALKKPIGSSHFPAWIDWAGPPGTYPTYSFAQVLSGAVPASAFRDKIVIVGATDPIEKDIFPTPASANEMPGAEIHANSVATILAGFPLRPAGGAVNWILLVALALLVPLATVRLTGARALLVAAGLLVSFPIAVQLTFDAGRIVDLTYPALALLLGTAGAAAIDYFTETRERSRMRRVLTRFVPEQIVADVLDRTDEDLRLGGATIEATVLFCDLRGFTRFAESHSAATVIESLNRYLTEMSEAVLGHGGTLVSYLGDGIMAVFGAPIEKPTSPDDALAAAREMLDVRLPAFNRWFRDRDLGDGFRIGIGLSTGPVRSGNVGSERRLEYTAVGDTTNIAARLQAKSKELPHQLLVAESTWSRLQRGRNELSYVGEFVLAGRSAATKVWTFPAADVVSVDRVEHDLVR